MKLTVLKIKLFSEAGQTPEDDTNYESVVEGSNPNGQDMIGNIPEMPEISAEDRVCFSLNTHTLLR